MANGWIDPKLNSIITLLGVSAVPSDGTATPIPTAHPMLYNGTTWDRQRGNDVGQTLLASAARTSATYGSTQTNYNARGVILTMTITAAPNTAETLGLFYVPVDPLVAGTSNWPCMLTSPAGSTIQAGATLRLFVYPGASTTPDNSTLNKAYAHPVPRSWTGGGNPSSSGSWTYAIGFQYVV